MELDTMKYYTAINRKKEILPFTKWIDLEDIMLKETSQTEKNQKQIPHVFTFMWNLKAPKN